MATTAYARLPTSDPPLFQLSTGADGGAVAVLRRDNAAAAAAHFLAWVIMAVWYGTEPTFQRFSVATSMVGQKFNTTTFETEDFRIDAGSVNIPTLVAGFEFVTFAFHVVEALWAEEVLKMIRAGAQWLRWTEYSISASLMMLAIGLTSRVTSVGDLTTIFVLTAATMFLGGASESALRRSLRVEAVLYAALSFATFFAAWLPILVTFFATITHVTDANGDPIPAFVWVIVIMLLVFMLQFAAVHVWKMAAMWGDDPLTHLRLHGLRYERAYVLLSFAAKFGLAWAVFGAAFQVADAVDIPPPAEGYSRWILIVFVCGGVVWATTVATFVLRASDTLMAWGGLASAAPGVYAAYRWAAPAAAACELAHVVVAIIDIDDTRRHGWAFALVLGVHLVCEAAYVAAVERALAKDATNAERSVLRGILWIAAAAYIVFYVLTLVYATQLWVMIVAGVAGGIASLFLTIFDAFLYPAFAFP